MRARLLILGLVGLALVFFIVLRLAIRADERLARQIARTQKGKTHK